MSSKTTVSYKANCLMRNNSKCALRLSNTKLVDEIHSFNVARNTFIIFVGLEAATTSEDRNRLNNE